MLFGWVGLCTLQVQSVLFNCVEDVDGDLANFSFEVVLELSNWNLEAKLKTDVR